MSIPLLIEVQKFSRYFYLLTNYDGFYFLAFLFVIIFVIYQEAFGNMITIWAFVILGLVFANLVSTQPINFILSDYIVDRTFFVSIPTTSQSQNCSMKLKIDSKKADVDLSCIKNAAPYKIIFNVSEQIENQSYDIHSFKLEGISQTHSVGVINVTVSTVAQWNYFLKIKLNQTGVIILTGNFTQDQFLIADFIFFYSVLSIIVLPPFLQYHWNIVGYSLLTMMSSQLLMFSVLSNSFVALWKYKDHILTSSLYVFLLILSCLIQLVQFYFKVRILIKNVYLNYSSNRSRILIISLFYAILIALSILYYRVHKDVTTYCAFAATLFYYMSSFLIVPKNSRAYFSFRGVLLDGISIVFLTLMSRIYPIMHYKIATFYTMMGSFLIFWVILLYSVTIFILINIVKRDSNKTSFNQSQILSLQSFSGAQNKCDWKQDDEQNKEKGRQMKIEEQREEIQREKQQQSEDSQKKWKKIKQLSMMSQIVNSSNIISRNQDQIKDTVQI